jgi:hypothetical protein
LLAIRDAGQNPSERVKVMAHKPRDRLAFFRKQAAEAKAKAEAAPGPSSGHRNLTAIAASWQHLAAIEERLRADTQAITSPDCVTR